MTPPRSRHPVLVALLASLLVASAASAELRLIPEPRQVTLGSGTLALKGDVTIAVPGGDAADRFAAEGLRDEIESATGVRPKITDGRDGTIVLARSGSASNDDESYKIEVKSSGARVTAATAAGLFYGTQTLRQMVEPSGIPAATIDDRPSLRWRGVHDDLSRGPLGTVETLQRRIRTAAELKLNFYVLYLETAFDYRSQPLIVPPGGALTEAEVRDLVAYAQRWHVALVPEQQTTGHLTNVLRYERYAPLAEVPHGSTLAQGPESDAFVRSLYDELAPLFPGPFLHLGADEIGDIGKGKTKVPAGGVQALYSKHLQNLHQLMRPYGKRLMFWGDVCVDHPEIVKGLPSDYIVASWCYEAKDDYGKWITPFRDAKLDLIVCPGTANWNRVLPNLDVALPNIRDFVREGRRAGAMGALTCTWADNGDAPFDLNWYALAGGAAASWQEASLDTVRLRRAFDWALFRNPGTDVADALAAMQRNHRRVMSIRRHDANLVLFWQNPTSNPIDRRLLAALEPVAADLRLDAEKALESLLRVRPRARRNAEVIDAYAFAARRLRTIGIRAEMAKRLPQLYEDVLAKTTVGSPVANAKPVLAEMSRLLVEGRDDIVTLRAEHERLWRQENRPYWLGNVLALYDHDLEGWITKLETVRLIEFGLRSGLRPPPIEQVGLEP